MFSRKNSSSTRWRAGSGPCAPACLRSAASWAVRSRCTWQRAPLAAAAADVVVVVDVLVLEDVGEGLVAARQLAGGNIGAGSVIGQADVQRLFPHATAGQRRADRVDADHRRAEVALLGLLHRHQAAHRATARQDRARRTEARAEGGDQLAVVRAGLEQRPATLAVARCGDRVAAREHPLAQGHGPEARVLVDGFDVVAVIDQAPGDRRRASHPAPGPRNTRRPRLPAEFGDGTGGRGCKEQTEQKESIHCNL